MLEREQGRLAMDRSQNRISANRAASTPTHLRDEELWSLGGASVSLGAVAKKQSYKHDRVICCE